MSRVRALHLVKVLESHILESIWTTHGSVAKLETLGTQRELQNGTIRSEVSHPLAEEALRSTLHELTSIAAARMSKVFLKLQLALQSILINLSLQKFAQIKEPLFVAVVLFYV